MIQASQAIRSVLRRGDIAARVGGDEFAIVLHEADAVAAQGVAGRILEAVAAVPATSNRLRLSLGIAVGGVGADPTKVHDRADNAMYEAKRRGGMTWIQAADDQTATPIRP